MSYACRRAFMLTVFGVAVLSLPVATETRHDQKSASQSPPVLAANWPATRLREVLLARDAWKPAPSIADRDKWIALSDGLKSRISKEGQRALTQPIPALPATLFLDYTRNGNRSRFEALMFGRRARLHALVLAECLEDRGRFLDAIVDTVWAIAEESSWTVPAHQGAQKAKGGLPDTDEPIVDLFAAQTAHSFSWTLYLLGDRLDKVSPLVRPRMAREIERRVLGSYLARDDFWWMGFAPRASRPNNWNPWINSNVLVAALLVEPSDQRRAEIVHKALRSLDKFLGPHPKDGSCDEGPAYWTRAGASVFESLELLQSASGGRINEFADPVIANMGRFAYRARISGDWVVDVGDSDPRVEVDRSLAYRYGVAIGDPLLRAFGASGATEESVALDDRSIGRAVFGLFGWEDMANERNAPAPLPRDVWLPSEDMQLMAARDGEGSADGLYVAAWGAHNDQSHNHNDVGNVIVFVDGVPVLVDAGRPVYTAQTFSIRRYDIWEMQSAFHNLPTVNGVMQMAGRKAAARDVTYAASDDSAELRMDIAPAYPPSAGIVSWRRSVRLNRGRNVTIADRATLGRVSRDVSVSLMTPCDVREETPGQLRFTCAVPTSAAGAAPVVFARFDQNVQAATVERIDLDDPQLKRAWGDHLNRVVLKAREPADKVAWTLVLSK
jgi:hypothetical protein